MGFCLVLCWTPLHARYVLVIFVFSGLLFVFGFGLWSLDSKFGSVCLLFLRTENKMGQTGHICLIVNERFRNKYTRKENSL